MQPWKSQRVEDRRQTAGRQHARPDHAPSSPSASPLRPAAVTSRLHTLSKDMPISLLSSPSRGLDATDSSRDLTNGETQARYREHISQRILAHCERYGHAGKHAGEELFPVALPGAAPTSPRWVAAGLEGGALQSLQEVLILVRRLREGCISAARRDAFTADVYALSALLSILVGDEVQLSSSLPRLVDLITLVAGQAPLATAEADMQVLLASGSKGDMGQALRGDHIASLYLMWLSVSGGEVARIGGAQREAKRMGGAWQEERERVMAGLSEEERGCGWIKTADCLHSALARDNVIQLRTLLVDGHCTVWQRAIARRSVERMRGTVWTTLVRAYLQAPLDGHLVGDKGGGDDWLERMLFIDTRLVPPAAPVGKGTGAKGAGGDQKAVPDDWDDDSVLQATAALHAATLDDGLGPLRAARLAALFSAFQLPPSPSDDAVWPGPLQEWSGRRVGAANLKLR